MNIFTRIDKETAGINQSQYMFGVFITTSIVYNETKE